MAVPRKKTSRSKRGMRRSHDGLRRPTLIKCKRCSTPVEPHTVCGNCGHYGERSVLEIEEV